MSGACKFAVNQIVVVTKKLEIPGELSWNDITMNRVIGKEGQVRQAMKRRDKDAYHIRVAFPHLGCSYWFLEDSLEFAPFPVEWAYFTTSSKNGKFAPAGPDHRLEEKDRINFGTDKFDAWHRAYGLVGSMVKDIKCKAAEAYVTAEVVHTLKSYHQSEAEEGFHYYTPRGKFSEGTEHIVNHVWVFSNLDGEPVPDYPEGTERPLYRRPSAECGLYQSWLPAAPGELRPDGLQYRRKGHSGAWKNTKVAGKPVEQGDIDCFDYRIPKEAE